MSLWDKVQAGVKKAGETAGVAAQKAKLRADMLFIDREMTTRKKTFGLAMYDHISPLSQSQDFYAANDDLTNMIRPRLIEAQKEIQALAAKRIILKESLAQAEAHRAGAFPTKAETYSGKLMNFGKAGGMHSKETKIKTELAFLEQRIKGFKQSFGIAMYDDFAKAEDTRGYLPTDRQIRSIYDSCRNDLQGMETNKQKKLQELIALGGNSAEDNTIPSIVENIVENNHHHQQQGYGSHNNDLSMQSSYAAPTNGGYGAPNATNGSTHKDPDDLLL